MPDYSRAFIYGIVDLRSSVTIYLGSTCNQLCCRMGNHRSIVSRGVSAGNGAWQLVHRHMKREGIFNFGVVEVERFPCAGRQQLRARERELVLERKPQFFNAGSMVLAITHCAERASVRCTCGARVTRAGLRSHQRTTKHLRASAHKPAIENAIVPVAKKQPETEPE